MEKKIVHVIGEIGRLLLRNGAEIYRVEESIDRSLRAYGYQEIEVFAITTYFSLSVTLHSGDVYTITKRSRHNQINLDTLYALNHLVRKISASSMSVAEIEAELEVIKAIPVKMHLVFIGYGISTAAFTIFFGGSIPDMVVGVLVGFIIYFAMWLLEVLDVNNIVTTLVVSMLLSAVTVVLKNLGIIDSLQAVTTAGLMLLVPGVAITNSLRDIIGGEYVSGLARMTEAILIAVSIAIGVGTMMIILGG